MENKVKIIADSSCDIFSIPGIDFSSVPLTISTNEKSFTDDENLCIDSMLDHLENYHGRSYTSCPSIDSWLESYAEADIIYVVVLSSGISGTYNAAMAAADIYKKSHPEAKIHVFDTRSAGTQVRMAVDKIAEYIRQGKDFEEVCKLTEKYIKHSRIFFALESFHNFAQNGRVNKTIAKLASIFGIRIMATGSTEGKIEILKKCRGAKNTIRSFLECISNAGYTGEKCYIAHCKNHELANEISKKIRGLYPKANINIYETRGLCSYYAEKGGVLLSCECEKIYG